MDEILKSIETSFENLRRRINSLEVQDPIYAPSAQAAASGNLVLTNAFQNIVGATLTLEAGNYTICGIFDVGGNDAGQTFEGRVLVGATPTTILATTSLEVGTRNTVVQYWLIQLTVPTVVILQARKTGGAGASTVYSGNTTLTTLGTS